MKKKNFLEGFDFRLKKKKGEKGRVPEAPFIYIYIYIYIYMYIMDHEGNEKKKKICFVLLVGVYPRQVRDLTKYIIIYFL